jgi:RND family efflux transporter MFP subunit
LLCAIFRLFSRDRGKLWENGLKRGVKHFFAGITAAAVLVALANGAGAQTMEPTRVGVDKVRLQSLAQTVPVIGRLVARQAGVVASRIGGPVASIQVEVGDRVRAKAVLATLVANRAIHQLDLRKAEVTAAEAKLMTAQAQAAMRRQELARLEGLRSSAAFSQGRFADKAQEVAIAQSEIREAEARLDQAIAIQRIAEIELGNMKIRAPYPGVVTERHTEAGAYLRPGDPVVSLINDKDLEVEADVPSSRLGGLAPGVVVEGELAEGRPLRATVRAVVPEENPLTRTRRVRFLPVARGNGGALAANQSVTLHLPVSAPRKALTLNKDAVLNRNGKTLVFVVADNRANLRMVRLGAAVGGRFEVLEGLSPGDIVIVRGNERIQPGERVRADPGPK